jgi:hypothetical protein
MDIMEQQIRARLGYFQQKINKSKEKDFFKIQREFNSLVGECLTILAETIDNKCVPKPENDFKKPTK